MEAEVSSLEELIQHATNPQNAAVSTAAVGAFVEAVRQSVDRNGEASGDISVEGSPASSIAHAAAKLIAAKVQSPIEWEALQALNVLEACMGGCGPVFRAEVGKFRFLNELIKLVSPKYLGGRTPPDVQARVLALLRHWASVEGQNPPLPKVREAYAMLRKQGVVKDGEPFPPSAVGASSNTHPAMTQPPGQQPAPASGNMTASILPGQPQRPKAAAFEDEHLSRLLQRLLQSKHPRDIQDANRLIKAMVRQEEMRAERRSRRATELESARTSARLLWEMLDSWSRDGGGVGRAEDEKELMAELHASCGRIAQIIPRLATDAPDEATMAEVLQTSDELNKAMDKYNAVMVRGEITPPAPGGASLLDLSTPSEEQLPPALLEKDLADLGIGTESKSSPAGIRDKELQAVLGDLFGGTSDSLSSVPTLTKPGPLLVPHTQAPSEIYTKASGIDSLESGSSIKTGGLNDLDALGESLLKQSLPPSIKPSGPVFNKAPEKIPMNLLGRASSGESCKNPKSDKEPSFPLIGGSGMFMDSSSLSPNKESSKTLDIELLSDLMTQAPTTNAKANSEANSLDYLIGLSLSGAAAKTAPIISSGKPLIPQTESMTTSTNPASVSAFPSALNNKPIGSSIPNTSKVPSVVIPNAASSASAVTFPSNISPAHTNLPPIKKTDSQTTGQDSVSSGMNLQSLEVLVESVLMGSGSSGGNRQSDSEGVSLLENALKSLMQPKDVKEVQSNTVSEKSKRASVDEEGLNGSGDDAMVSWSDGEAEVGEKKVVPVKVAPEVKVEETTKVTNTVKPIGDINIPLQRIRPGKTPPIVALAGEDGSGISVELRLGHAESGLEGREDVSVLVITITSRLETPISNCLFQAVVPKGCRLRLLPASGTDLPAHNPFLPPAAITQVMLIASATKESICLKWVLSYVTEDEETATEMGEVAKLPLS